MRKGIVLSLVIIITLFIIRLFCGIYTHDEFSDNIFFIKHRPTWKWRFYSPIGMSDTRIEELTNAEKIEQIYFKEFVTDQGLSR
jgi:hypothetical protein